MEDLSHMISQATGLTGGESMNAANMISDRPDSLMSAPGSNPLLPEGITDSPELDVPPLHDYRPLVK
jgi:hypothetical protein